MATTIDQRINSYENISISIIQRHCRLWMIMLLIASDILSLSLASLVAYKIYDAIGHFTLDLNFYLSLRPVILVFVIAYAISRLYPTVGLNPIEEMRRLSLVTTVTFFLLIAITFWARASLIFSRLLLSMFWTLALITVPAMRWLVRRIAVQARAWGEPIAVIGSGPQTLKTIEFFRSNGQMGLVPVVLVNGFNEAERYPKDILILHSDHLKASPDFLMKHGIQTAILVPGETPAAFQSLIVDNRQYGFKRLVLISSLGWVGGSAIIPYDLQGVLGLEVQRKLLDPAHQLFKRLLDLILVIGGGVLAFPLIGLIALLVRLDSPGGSFYGQRRVGLNGREFKVWKFRTMVMNADLILENYLIENPELRAEWEANQKLKHDPRLTRLGRILRKTSLDELPQLWNVFKGEMGLVGPRPIVKYEIKHYGQAFGLYTQVLPGMTGLWQVSGRSDTSYDSRVRLDEYYIRHWSIWMDIYVLVRTIWVVIKGSGAY